MKIIYYNINGWICERYPYNISIDDTCTPIEVTDEEYNFTLMSPEYYAWRIINNKLVNEPYTDLTLEQQEEKRKNKIQSEIQELKNYLSSTDYVVTKMLEAQLNSEVVINNDYAAILQERNKARARINELRESL